MTYLEECFGELEDPRAANASYRLGDLLVVIVAASMCGQVTATDIALFAELRRDALRPFVSYERAPSHDTVSRLLRVLDPEAFSRCFARFAEGLARSLSAVLPDGPGAGGMAALAVDGKVLARAADAARAQALPMTVSLFCTRTGLALAAERAGGPTGKNEVEAARAALELIDLKGRYVTADALHCTVKTLARIAGAGADYVVALKRNRPAWHDEATALMAGLPLPNSLSGPGVVTPAHGRTEARAALVVAAPTPRTGGHRAYGKVVAWRNGKRSERLYMLSREITPEALIALTRAHWQIESRLHWSLDVQFGEDATRARRDNAPANLATAKRLARNILQAAETGKTPISQRITKCTFSDAYLITALSQMR